MADGTHRQYVRRPFGPVIRPRAPRSSPCWTTTPRPPATTPPAAGCPRRGRGPCRPRAGAPDRPHPPGHRLRHRTRHRTARPPPPRAAGVRRRRSYGTALMARQRIGAVVLADARRLPLPDGTVDAVSAVRLLHLLRGDDHPVRAVVAEAARVLRPGGVFVTTVDKAAGQDVGGNIDAVLAPHLGARPVDAAALVAGYAAGHGLEPAGEAGFAGHGQGRTPLRTARSRTPWPTGPVPSRMPGSHPAASAARSTASRSPSRCGWGYAPGATHPTVRPPCWSARTCSTGRSADVCSTRCRR